MSTTPTPLLLAIDQGTSSTKTLVFDREGRVVARASVPLRSIYEGDHAEQSPEEILQNVKDSVHACLDDLRSRNGNTSDILSMGISNQRETFIVWDDTGKPLYNAILWQCKRSTEICDRLAAQGLSSTIKEITGLVVDPYFSGTKMIWLYENNAAVRAAVDAGTARFGTVDTWLLYNLTNGRSYLTDHTNASRTMFFNLKKLDWDHDLLSSFGLVNLRLPECRPSASDFGTTDIDGLLHSELPISAMIGDSHAAAFGEGCFHPGMAKATMGTGCSILMNIGDSPIPSANGMVTTICWSAVDKVNYALEGLIVSCGATIEWLKNDLGLISDSAETESIARSMPGNGGVYLVPAFSGLGAPYWQMGRRASITGITLGTKKEHIIRAALESIPYQVADVITAMEKDAGMSLETLMVDGGISANVFILSFLSNLLNKPVTRFTIPDLSAQGAALLAGLQSGVYADIQAIETLRRERTTTSPAGDGSEKGWHEGWLVAINAGTN